MSPLVWDLGHIAAFEDLWLCRGRPAWSRCAPSCSQVYDACETPRADRGDMPYLRRDEALALPRRRCASARSRCSSARPAGTP